MKLSNAVGGTEVQVKHDCRGYADEFIKEGLVCNVSRIDYISDDYELRLKHPDIDGGFAWVNASDVRKYIKPTTSPFDVAPVVTHVPVRKDLSSLRVGDYIVANGTDAHLQEGVAYRVVQEGATFPMVALHHSKNADWRKAYCVIPRNVAKILREVDDATPRMAKSGSESTCRSE